MRIGRRLFLGGGAALLGACATTRGGAADVEVTEFDLWPSGPPGGEKVTVTEHVIERSMTPGVRDRAVLNVRRPRVKVFRPASPSGAAMLIAPGGAYQRVVLDKEGDETALRLAEEGVTSAVLIYRFPGDGWAAGWQAPLQDAQRGMRLLRAGKFASVDAKRIGVLGFSAGGHLAAALQLLGGTKTYEAVDTSDAVSARPDFACLVYAAYLNGQGQPALMVGPTPPPDLPALVDARTQPTFLLHAADDPTVPVAGSVRMFAQLKAAGVPAELHVFETGGHGFGIAKAKGLPAEAWPDLFVAWARGQRFF